MAVSRKIEVQLVGDAGDLERSLAGALASLKAFGDGAQKSGNKAGIFSKSTKDAERGLYDFDKAASKVNKTMSGGPFNLFDAVGNVGYGLLKLGGFAQKAGDSFGGLFKGLSTGEAGLTGIGSAIGQLGPLLGIAAGGFVALGAALLVLPAIAGAVVFVLTALLDVITILTAAVAAFAGPLLVVTGLLGGLGAAFAYVAVQSFKNQATTQQLHDNLLKLHVAQQTYNADLAKYGKNATQTENALLALHKAQDAYDSSLFGTSLHLGELHDKFEKLVHTLSARFRPELLKLAGAAITALSYLNKIAKLPLEVAFRDLATQGVALLSKFVYGVANVLKKPFRLAISLAFGSGGGGDNAQTALTNWWDSLTRYLFGYTKTKPIHIGSMIVFEQKNIQGALDPLFNWFMRQGPQMVATGLRWSHDIINGLINAWNHDKGLRNTVKAILNDAGHQAGRAFKAAFWAEIHNIPWKSLGLWILHQLDFSRALERLAGAAFNWIKSKASGALGSIAAAISSRLSDAWGAVKNAAGNAWDWIRNKATAVWNYIKGLFSQALSLHISVPSLPSSVSSLLSKAGGIFPATGGLVTGGIPGVDSVPAMLTPGEIVLNRQQQLSLLHGGPRGGGDVYVYIGNEAVDQHLVRIVRSENKQTARAVQAGSVWG